MALLNLKRMTDFNLAERRVLIREDLNAPVKNGRVTSTARLEAAIPTLKLALEQRARVLVMSQVAMLEARAARGPEIMEKAH